MIYKDLDFIEIGTSNFNTLIQTCPDTSVGFSIEAVNYYLEQLPQRKNVTKVNKAITGDDIDTKTIKIYYIPENLIIENNLPFWFRGCNKIGEFHPLHIKHNVTHLVKIDDVELMNIGVFLRENNIRKIKYFQIDTEGHDINIMNGLYKYLKNLLHEFYPEEIKFETNQNCTIDEVDEVLNLYSNLGYVLSYRNQDADTIITLTK